MDKLTPTGRGAWMATKTAKSTRGDEGEDGPPAAGMRSEETVAAIMRYRLSGK